MEKVSAMKKVALFLMIVGLAVALVACQGAVGPQGPKGDDGADGTDGTDGTHGTDGTDALLATNIPGIYYVNDKAGATATDPTVYGDDPEPFSVAGHFIGGTGERTYEGKDLVVNLYYTVEVSADGMVTLTVRDDNNDGDTTNETVPTGDGLSAATFSILATDENDISATKEFTVVRNMVLATVERTDGEILHR